MQLQSRRGDRRGWSRHLPDHPRARPFQRWSAARHAFQSVGILPSSSSQVNQQRPRCAPGLFERRRILQAESPNAGGAHRKRVEVRVEGNVPAPFCRHQVQRLGDQSQRRHARFKEQKSGLLRLVHERLGKHRRPTAVAKQPIPGSARGQGRIAVGDLAGTFQVARLPGPFLPHDARLLHHPGGAADGPL